MSGNNNGVILFVLLLFILAVTMTMYYFRCKIFQTDCGKCKLFNFGCPDRIPEGTYYCQEVPGSLIINSDGIQIVISDNFKSPIAQYTYDKKAGTISIENDIKTGSSPSTAVTPFVAKFDSDKNIISGTDFIRGSARNLTFKLNGSPYTLPSTPPSTSPSPPRSSP
jgi:hypothetical protein